MNTELIRLKEMSKAIGLSTATLRRMIKRKELEAVLLGGNYYVRPKDYYDFLCDIECKKRGVTREQMVSILNEYKRQEKERLLKAMGGDKLNKEQQDFVRTAMGLQ